MFFSYSWSFDDVHVNAARRIARISREEGVDKLIHVSHLNAGKQTSNLLADGSKWLLTKVSAGYI